MTRIRSFRRSLLILVTVIMALVLMPLTASAATMASGLVATSHLVAGVVGTLGSLGLFVGLFGLVNLNDDAIKYLIKTGFLDAAGGLRVNVLAKTADYTILAASDASGTIFTNRGATGAVVFTLPAPALAMAGVFYEFLGFANQNMTVATATADTFVTVADAAADSVIWSTSSQKVGAHARVLCDGTSWFYIGDTVGITYTVNT